MLTVVLLSIGAALSAATSSVLKHRSANTKPAAWAQSLPPSVASIVGNPRFAMAMAFDAGGVILQILALRRGDLSVVQPILTAALVFSLILNHLICRTRMPAREILLAATLVAGLATFLASSGSMAPQGEIAIGEKGPGFVLAAGCAALVISSLITASKASPTVGARAIAASVAAIYATTAALIKSSTHIYSLHGLTALLSSWQLWVLIAAAAYGLALNQKAFSMAPLSVSLPVTASLDPLFSVLVGVAVYDEQLRTTPLSLLGEGAGLLMLVGSVAMLSKTEAVAEIGPEPSSDHAGTGSAAQGATPAGDRHRDGQAADSSVRQ